jgi:cyclic pyranopterin phosphate synthase
MLADSFGRVATDLRVSLTDRCNLRCTYCMPAEGLDWLPRAGLLTDEEIIRLITIAVTRLGITEIRFTGGEPLLHRGLPALVARAAQLRPRPEISLTTNGIGLARLAGPLREAGLDRLNVSLDTLSPATFRQLARRDRLADVLAGLAAAALAGLTPVKVNAVLMRGINDDEAPRLLAYCLDRGYQLRFIEQMPLDAQHGWQRSEMVTADEMLQSLSREFALTPDDPAARGAAPAEIFLVNGGPARVGVIASVTRPFCGACDRVRLTADGQDIAARWARAVAVKLPGHGINDPGFLQPVRPMSAIGG